MNTKVKHRRLTIVAAIVAVAISGLILVNTDRVSADNDAVVVSNELTTTPVPTDTAEPLTFSSTVLPSMAKIMSALVIVVFCIYLAIFGLKKLMGRKYSGNGGLRILEVIETTGVSPKKTVSLVRVADKSVLVGITESSMTVLTELDAEETAKILAGQECEAEPDRFDGFVAAASQKIKELSFKGNTETAQV